jgi:hypothetical protein
MMRRIFIPAVAGMILLITAAFLLILSCPRTAARGHLLQIYRRQSAAKVVGLTSGEAMSGAIVQLQGTPIQVTSDKNGAFTPGRSDRKRSGGAGWLDRRALHRLGRTQSTG